jgi:hypothetical protein
MFPFRPKARPKTDDQITYPATLHSVIYPPQGGSVIASPPLPISPYTGQPYDPAWVAGDSGKTNSATIALMKSIESDIKLRCVLRQMTKEQGHAE